MDDLKMVKKLFYCKGNLKAKDYVESITNDISKKIALEWLDNAQQCDTRFAIELTMDRSFSIEELLNVLSDAFYGGIGYWAVINNSTKEWSEINKMCPQDATFEDIALRVLLIGSTIEMYDAEGEGINGKGIETNPWKLSLEDLISGIKMHMEKSKHYDIDEWDSTDGDCVIQYALFKEVIFG